ncbi:hypothetical protein AMECASPLE_001515 [Ameca splendens]|uniref:Uncharacterized protein n=1 Tax=Ameca splendens TaxID=208324 RepID=A0ABV0XAY4_9TELE
MRTYPRCRMQKTGWLTASSQPSSCLLFHTPSGPAGLCPDTSARVPKVTHGCSGTEDLLHPWTSDDWKWILSQFFLFTIALESLCSGYKHSPVPPSQPYVVSV